MYHVPRWIPAIIFLNWVWHINCLKTDASMFTARAKLEKMFLIAGWRLKCFPLFHSLRPDLTCVYHQTTRSGTVNVHSWQWAINNLQKHAQCTYSMEHWDLWSQIRSNSDRGNQVVNAGTYFEHGTDTDWLTYNISLRTYPISLAQQYAVE